MNQRTTGLITNNDLNIELIIKVYTSSVPPGRSQRNRRGHEFLFNVDCFYIRSTKIKIIWRHSNHTWKVTKTTVSRESFRKGGWRSDRNGNMRVKAAKFCQIIHTWIPRHNKRPMGHIAHLRKQFKSINTYDYIITTIKRRKKTLLS